MHTQHIYPVAPPMRVLELSVGEDFVILACVVLTQTEEQTDNPTVANTGLCIASYADAL